MTLLLSSLTLGVRLLEQTDSLADVVSPSRLCLRFGETVSATAKKKKGKIQSSMTTDAASLETSSEKTREGGMSSRQSGKGTDLRTPVAELVDRHDAVPIGVHGAEDLCHSGLGVRVRRRRLRRVTEEGVDAGDDGRQLLLSDVAAVVDVVKREDPAHLVVE